MRASSAPTTAPPALGFFEQFDAVFDVLQTERRRAPARTMPRSKRWSPNATAAKKARNFARADQIRDQLLEQGIILEDTKSGVRWKRK